MKNLLIGLVLSVFALSAVASDLGHVDCKFEEGDHFRLSKEPGEPHQFSLYKVDGDFEMADHSSLFEVTESVNLGTKAKTIIVGGRDSDYMAVVHLDWDSEDDEPIISVEWWSGSTQVLNEECMLSFTDIEFN